MWSSHENAISYIFSCRVQVSFSCRVQFSFLPSSQALCPCCVQTFANSKRSGVFCKLFEKCIMRQSLTSSNISVFRLSHLLWQITQTLAWGLIIHGIMQKLFRAKVHVSLQPHRLLFIECMLSTNQSFHSKSSVY